MQKPDVIYQSKLQTGRSTDGARADYVWLAAIMLIALVLRLYKLDASLWYDEIDTLVHYVRLPTSELINSYSSLNNHMLFSLEAQLSIALFGESAWALRLPAVVMGLGSIWVLWLLVREVATPWEARLSALLMAVSYHHIWFSQNARGYTGLLFWGLLATYFLVRGMRRPGWRLWLAYGLCLAASMYTHLSAAFVFFSHGLAYLVLLAKQTFQQSHKKTAAGTADSSIPFVMPLVGVVFGLLLTLLLFAPLLSQMVQTFSSVSAGPKSAAAVASIAEWKSPLWMIREIAGTFSAFGPIIAIALPFIVIVLAIAFVSLFRKTPILPLIFLFHIPITVAVLVFLSFRVWPRYFFVDLGLICLFLIHGAFAIGRIFDRVMPARLNLTARHTGIALSFFGIAASLVLLPGNYTHPKQDFLGARNYVEANRAVDSTVISLGLSTMPFALYYAPNWQSAETLDGFQETAVPGKETWVVYTFPKVIERRHRDIFDYLGDDYSKAAYFRGTLGGGGIVVLKSNAN